MAKRKDNFLAYSIIFAAVAIAGALVFFGIKWGGISEKDLQISIQKGIEDYVAAQQAEAEKQQQASQPHMITGDYTGDGPVLGDKDALVTIVEFSDYECPFCKKFFTDTFSKIKANYIDTGKAKLVFRNFPLSFHNPLATKEAMAAECARDQKGDKGFFQYHDLLFKNTTSNGNGLTDLQLTDFAKKVGANEKDFTDCLTSEKYKDMVATDIADGKKAGVTGTPTLIINGMFIPGAQDFSLFQKTIDDALAAAAKK